ncbi:tudor domain-containing protein [Gimesia algae]|uniref:Uncharacterized protein n=1 Tax=Gimesia algae TaxID=2527971 RepID=A0A517VH89_9PLAN|nr:hypothetical protein [Gimesia algae]QDT92345.1 hypothetical protein Pan161_40120 [Gimesia algae]
MSTPSPRRRHRKPPPPLENTTEVSGPKKKRHTNSRRTTRQRNESMLRVVLFGIAGLILIYGLFFMDWHDIGGIIGLSRSRAKLLKDLEYYQNEQLELIASFQTKEQAKAAVPRLNEIAKELALISAEFDDWVIVEDKDDIEAAMQLPPEVREEHSRFARDFRQKRSHHSVRLTQEINRLRKESGIGNYINTLVVNSLTYGGRFAREWELDKAKEGAFKNGYSPVTAGTVLKKGMQIQGINSQYDWQDCIIKEIYSDGKVRVNFIDGNPHSLFGGQGFLDYKYERDRLRIPDTIPVRNTSVPTRNSNGTAQPVPGGNTGRRIDFPPPKRVPSNRSF